MNKNILIATLALALSPALAFARSASTPVVRGHSVSVHDHTQPVRTHTVVAHR
jgi:hypothetical protein